MNEIIFGITVFAVLAIGFAILCCMAAASQADDEFQKLNNEKKRDESDGEHKET